MRRHRDIVLERVDFGGLMAMVLAMNGLAIWLRYRMRKNIKW